MGRRLRDFAQQRISLLPMTQHFLVKFSSIITLSTTRTADPLASGIDRFVGLEHIEPENLHIRSWGLVADGTTFTNTFKRGQVLFGKRRAYQRKVAVADFDGVCSSDIYVFESKDPNVLLPELVPFILQSEGFYQYAVKTSAGSLSPRTNWTHLANYEFPLPSIEEQREIVNLLTTTNDYCDRLVEAENKLKVVFDSLVFDLLAHRETREQVKLSEVCSRITVGIASSAAHAYRETGIPLIRNTDINAGYISREGMPFLSSEFDEEYRTKRVNTGDVVIARTGKPGICAVVPPDLDNAQTFTTLIARPIPQRLNSDFLCWWLNSSHGQKFVSSRKAGGIQQNLNATLLQEMPISLPPLKEQEEIVAKIKTALDSLEAIAKTKNDTMKLLSKLREEKLSGNH